MPDEIEEPEYQEETPESLEPPVVYDWENPANILTNDDLVTTITLAPGEKSPQLISRQYKHDLQDNPNQIIFGYEVLVAAKVTKGNPEFLKELNVEISYNYNEYSRNKANQNNIYTSELQEFIYGSNEDMWNIPLQSQKLYKNQFMGVCLRYKNIGDSDITLEIQKVNLNVYSKYLTPYKYGEILEIDPKIYGVPIGIVKQSNATIQKLQSKSLGNYKISEKLLKKYQKKWKRLNKLPPDDSNAYVELDGGEISSYAIARRGSSGNIPANAKITKIGLMLHNAWQSRKTGKTGLYEAYIYACSANNIRVPGTSNLAKSNYPNVKKLKKAGLWKDTKQNGIYQTYELANLDKNYKNEKISVSTFNSSQFGVSLAVYNRLKKGLAIAHVGSTRCYAEYIPFNNYGTMKTFGVGVEMINASKDPYTESVMVEATPGEGMTQPNQIKEGVNSAIASIKYKVDVYGEPTGVGVNLDWNAIVKPVEPFIGQVILDQPHLIDSAKVKVSDTENLSIFRGSTILGKAGEAKESKSISITTPERNIISLKALPTINELFPVYTSPRLDDNDPLGHRGYANIYDVDSKYANEFRSYADFQLTYATKELYPLFIMDYYAPIINDDAITITPVEYELLINGYDYFSIDEDFETNSENTIPLSVTEDEGDIFTLKSDSMNEDFAEFNGLAEVIPTYKFSTTCQFENTNQWQNAILKYFIGGLTIHVGVSQDESIDGYWNDHVITLITNGKQETKTLKGAVGGKVFISGIGRTGNRIVVEVSSETSEKLVFTGSISQQSKAISFRLENYLSSLNEYYPCTVKMHEINAHKSTFAEGITLEPNPIVILPSQTKMRADPDFYRDSSEGSLPCYIEPSEELYYKLKSYHYYHGSVRLKHEDGTQLLSKDFVIKPKDVFEINNGVTKMVVRFASQEVDIYGFMSGWKFIKTFRLENILDIAFTEINSNFVEVRIGTTYWRMDRGRAFINVRHEDTDIYFKNFDNVMYDAGDNALESFELRDDANMDIPLTNLFFCNFEDSNCDAGIQILASNPKTINAEYLPASELTGIGWYQKEAEDFESYAHRAVEWLNAPIQEVILGTEK